MKGYFKKIYNANDETTLELSQENPELSLKKTREALDVAYSGFENAIDAKLIDSYIYEINALQKRFVYLTERCAKLADCRENLDSHTTIKALVSHVFS